MQQLALIYLKCKRCGHKWIPRTVEVPERCANKNCRSAYWNRPKKKVK